MLTEAELQKKWESLTFTDDFIFSRVMHNETICRQVVELILGVRIGKISYLSAQDEHKTDPDSMRIIMDVFCEMKIALSRWKCKLDTRRSFPNGVAITKAWQMSAPLPQEPNIAICQIISSFLFATPLCGGKGETR